MGGLLPGTYFVRASPATLRTPPPNVVPMAARSRTVTQSVWDRGYLSRTRLN